MGNALMIDRKQRYRGCLMGLAAGDALGTTLEFKPPGSFEPITEMIGGGPFGLSPGQWTDDTSMALCLAQSLIHSTGFDANDQMQRYSNWRNNGYMSSTGKCFDIGNTVAQALSDYAALQEPFSGSTNPFSAGNGSIMRLAPVAMYYSPDIKALIHYAGESSRTTHGAKECIDACQFMATLLHFCFAGTEKSSLLEQSSYIPETKKIKSIKNAEFLSKSNSQISGSGYVVESLEAALWCFYNTDNFADAVLAAANLGDDADTTAAVCGQIAGAYYGIEDIPEKWRDLITDANMIIEISDHLFDASNR